ncbi:hypothetical protein MMC27_001595 [Xylographa pallens]|nr:hypothetical protein [Xylographa pallens]
MVSMISDLYQQFPLSKTSNDIRLLLVHPADTPDDPLICDLQVASLDDSPEYCAISYTWGEHVFDQYISVSGVQFAVTKHLHSALQIFREDDRPIFWVDQICINQGDVAERSHQVVLMTRIYSQPRMVFVWLGEEIEETGDAFVFLYNLLQLNAPWQILDPSAHSRPWKGLFDILSRSWFSRVWIIQEVAPCDRISLFCGRMQMPFQALQKLLGLLENRWVDSTTFVTAQPEFMKRNMENLRMLFAARSWEKKKIQITNPLRIFNTFRGFEASDSRDKIYSLRGLIDNGAMTPDPDYTLSVETVYQDYARHLLLKDFGFQMLTLAGIARSHLSIPSWCPDWTYRSQMMLLATTTSEMTEFNATRPRKSLETIESLKSRGTLEMQPTFAASSGSEGSIKLTSNSTQISARGALIDTIAHIGRPSSELTGTMHDWWHAWATETLVLIRQFAAGRYSKSPDLNVDALSRLITADDALQIFKGPNVLKGFWSSVQNGSTRIEDFRISHEQLRQVRHAAPDARLPREFEIPQILMTAFCFVVPELVRGRRFCVTKMGFIGLVPDIVKVDDLVSIIFGITAPLILRKAEGRDLYSLVGDAFVLDAMHGEAMRSGQDIVLI